MRALALAMLFVAFSINESNTKEGKMINGILGLCCLVGCIICILGGW